MRGHAAQVIGVLCVQCWIWSRMEGADRGQLTVQVNTRLEGAYGSIGHEIHIGQGTIGP